MIKYCRADVELLSKAILKFKQMFQDKFDINPFKYITLASLCMAIFRGNFLEDDTIVANEQNKPVSKACKEWLIHNDDDKLLTEVPIYINTNEMKYEEKDLHKNKIGNCNKIYYKNPRAFVPDAVDKKKK